MTGPGDYLQHNNYHPHRKIVYSDYSIFYEPHVNLFHGKKIPQKENLSCSHLHIDIGQDRLSGGAIACGCDLCASNL